MQLPTIDKATARRFVLGRQGLWPGRRWTGKAGTAAAIRTAEAVQMDPLVVVARSHDITLWSRVLDYRPEHLHELLYHDRAFFDYGGTLFVYPMEELPFWRLHMRRRSEDERWSTYRTDNADLLDAVRAELRERGPLGNRDLTGNRIDHYRGRKDTALALFYLWLTGDVMIHDRRRFERVYDFRDRIIPPQWNTVASDAAAEHHFALKAVAFMGLAGERVWRDHVWNYTHRRLDLAETRRWLAALVDGGDLARITIEGSKDRWYLLHSDLPLLDAVAAGTVPAAWQPLDTTNDQEAIFLAPLDIVSARGRATQVFDFDYIWEVYKPAAARRWGYYTLPILYGDRLVARLDPKLDRGSATLIINGFWLETDALATDEHFISALAKALRRFATFLDAQHIDLAALQPSRLRLHLQRDLAKH